jgi:extracellular elastinolytic metalloproteinase
LSGLYIGRKISLVSSQQVHANGEIWTATNFRIRKLLGDKYDDDFPYDDVELQQACSAGEYPPQACPGNRRWMQLVFGPMLLMPTEPDDAAGPRRRTGR